MINLVIGAQGDGKTAFLMTELEEEFRLTERNICVSSIGFVPEKMIRYFAETYPDKRPIQERIRILTQEEAFTWWRYRGPDDEGHDVIWVPGKEIVTAADGAIKEVLTWPQFRKGDRGCCYFLDEHGDTVDNVSSGCFTPEHKSAIRHHRKSASDLWIGNPTLCDLAKPYRENIRFTYILENQAFIEDGIGKTTIRRPKAFIWRKYRRIAVTENAVLTGGFRLKPGGIHGCYNTASGSGVNNQVADQNVKRSGRSYKWWPVVLVVALVGLILLMKGCGTGLGFAAHGVGRLLNFGPGRVVSPSVPVKADPPKTNSALGAARSFVGVPGRSYRPPVFLPRIVWVSNVAGILKLGLDDGDVLENPPGIWTGRELLMQDGRIYEMRKK